MSSSSLEQASEFVLQSPAAARVTSNGVPAVSVAIGSIVLFSAVKKEDGEEEENQFVGVFKKTEAPQKKKNGQQRQNHHQQQQQQQQQKKDSDPTLPAVSIPLKLAAGAVLDDPHLDLPYVCGRFLTSVYRPALRQQQQRPQQQQQLPQQPNLREHLRQLQRRFFLDPRLNGQDKS